jgi:hypothetical protein
MSFLDKIVEEGDYLPIPHDNTPVVVFFRGDPTHPLLVSYNEKGNLTVLKCPRNEVDTMIFNRAMFRNMPARCVRAELFEDILTMAFMGGKRDIERSHF